MKKIVISVLVLLSTAGLYAQTGIGTSLPNPSSELEVASTNKGVLVPRLGLDGENDKSTIAGGNSYPEGLFVYNDGSKGFAAGFYYWAANKWNVLISNTSLDKYFNEKVIGNVTYKNGNFYYTIKDGDVYKDEIINIQEIIKNNSVLAKLDLTNETVNVGGVKAGFTFKDGKDGSTPVLFAETLTSIAKGVDGKDYIEYTYYNEAGGSTKLTVSQDIANDFSKIINEENNRIAIENIVKNVAGDVKIVKEGDDIKITYPGGSFNLTDEIRKQQTKSSLTVVPKSEGVSTQAFDFKVDGTSVAVDANFKETLTELKTTSRFLAKYQKGEGVQAVFEYVVVNSIEDSGTRPSEEYVYVQTFKETSFNYKDETGKIFTLVMNDLVGGTETITSLAMEELPKDGVMKPALVYTREDGKKDVVFFMDQDNTETLTSLSIADDLSGLIYIDENAKKNPVDIKPLIKQPWKKVNSNELPINGDSIYTDGWVGIGYNKPSGEPNEKLRVNGSITAVNSYYADYVFESYFTGSSALKYDYKFNDLSTVESFIKENNHLPGITPISDLSKSEKGYSFNISELSVQLLEKTEELYLHIIEQSKEIEVLKQSNSEIEKIKSENQDLKRQLERIEELLKEKLAK